MTNTLITRQGDEALLRPAGDVVAVTVSELRASLREVLGQGARDLVIDLENVQMIDSMGIGLLISAHNSVRKVGGRLSVIHATAEILELFRAMRIHQHFGVSGQ
jgi:anti-anti-sigma factor